MVDRVLAQLSPSIYEKSFASADNDVLSTGSTPHIMFASHVKENQRYSPPPTMYVQDQDARIVKLTDRVEGMRDEESSHAPGKRPQVQETVDRPTNQVEYVKEIQVSSEGTIPINQIREFIMGTIKDKYEVATKSSLTYARPYTARIDSLKMPVGYQPPKFQQFDGKRSPKQHVAHFIETYNNAGTHGDYLVKQFVCSFKGNVFDWYTALESGSIDSWEQMEQEFLNRFYSTRRVVSMVELTNTCQRNKEQVFDFINR
ncbi:uncharacterized protein LOC125858824 [Solanum stenotomum]|uniref:uncharacterized protein LOC125858824 n=1 Tax=Solanum stenotomum TaxID=172797 RepID=UPI0020D1B5AF|nr:uncharacterized protein LOC125858824 [Solanum stenotomum]